MNLNRGSTPGYEEGKLNNIDFFYIMIAELKNVRRDLVTNFYMDVQRFKEAIYHDEVKYEYKHGKYLNLIISDDGFARLYYYITEIDDYHIGEIDDICVCDVFFKVGNVSIDKIIMTICQKGFRQYKSYHKLIAKKPDIAIVKERSDIEIIKNADENTIPIMFQYFDKYSDCLPRRIELNKFIHEKKFLSLYDTKNHEFWGAMIYTEKKHSIVEEYIFIQKKVQGKGLGIALSSFWYQMFVGSDVKFITWVRDDNLPSIALHKKLNYNETKIKKITFLKG